MSDKEIDDGLDRCTVMVCGDKIIGFAITANDLLHLIMVDVPFQGKGCGGKLMKHTEGELFKNYETIRLQTFKENVNTAQFYLKNGWEITSQQEVPDLGLFMLQFEKKNGTTGGQYEH